MLTLSRHAANGALAAFALLISACASSPEGQPGEARVWMTSGDRSRLLSEEPALVFATRPTSAGPVFVVDPTRIRQEIVGFGAAVSDASAWLIQTRLSPTRRADLLGELFGRENGGLGFSFTRVTIGASDFSLDHYSLAEAGDPLLADFSTDRMAQYVFPTVRAALAINPDLKVMASPWSAPGWMKTTGSMIKGELKPEFYPTYADYLTRYIQSARQHGVSTDYLSIQNEPDFEPENYPGMRWGPEGRATFIGRDLEPRLRRAGLETRILDWDHNWDKPEQPLATLADPVARAAIAGVAWHCYAGDVAAQSTVRDAWPEKDVFFTECSGGQWAADFSDSLLWMTRSLIIGSTNHWARGVLMWNLALDESYGPHLGGCSDCRGVVTIDSRTGAITRNQEYYAFGHASRFVRPGARRLETSAPDGLLGVAFLNPDGERVLLALNAGDQPVAFAIHDGEREATAVLHAKSVATYVWQPG